jgi:uncharacterized membrane protein
MERLLRVLRRLGEPSDVISEGVSPAMVKLGKKKDLPFYILSGVLIALFGLPLGVGLVGVLIGVLAAILGLVLAYFVTAFSLLITGAVRIIASVIVIVDPAIIERFNLFFGKGNIYLFSDGFMNLLPQAEAFISIVVLVILAGLGALMLWGARHLLRRIAYLFNISWEKYRRHLAGTGGPL